MFKNTIKEVLDIEISALQNALNNQSEPKMEEMIESILNIKGKLIVTGVGKSGLIGAKISATLSSTGTPSIFLHPTEALHGDLGVISKEDMILAISYSGNSPELLAILPHLKKLGGKLITMSKDANSSLSKLGDYFLNIHVDKEACPLDIAPTSSTTLTLALGDALCVELMKRRHFSKNDFARYHPGGALGKRLYVRLDDLMKKDALPFIYTDTKLKDAIFTMSAGKIGSVIIIDKSSKIKAILSDGDLRRAMMKKDFSLDSLAIDFATLNPKICNDKNMLAYDALEFIEQNKIQLLVVCNKDSQVEGVVHIHDLLSAGIKK